MKQRIVLLIILISLFATNIFAQEESGFSPNGKPILRIFTNFNTTWTGSEAGSAFEIQRAYFGYEYHFSNTLSGKVILDVGDPNIGVLKMTAYLKNAYVQYKKDGLTAKIGMIGLYQFKIQDDIWGARYLYRSFMDQHKFGPSADLGAFVQYKFSDMLSADLTIANGEGYKRVQADSLFKYSGGLTLTPVKGLDLRASYDYMGKDSPQQTLAFSVGYKAEKLRLGAEYNYQLNHKMTIDNDLTGLSFYGSYKFEKFKLIGRYDNLSSPIIDTDTDPWNNIKDGQLFIAGIEFNPIKGIIITPNYQGWMPANGSAMINSAYLSLEIRY